jgi:hypothetical protein
MNAMISKSIILHVRSEDHGSKDEGNEGANEYN